MRGGQVEIKALAMKLNRQVKVFSVNPTTKVINLRQYPHSTDEAADAAEKGVAVRVFVDERGMLKAEEVQNQTARRAPQ